MPSRSGGFSAGLDPFGGSRGGLGRYNITGETIQSLAEYEAYAVAVAWANGQASDEVYLASLQKMVDLTNEGTRDRLTAVNRLEDAQYSIGRNVIATKVNGADTPAERTAALRELEAYDAARLAKMQPDNQAYRAQVDRVAGVRVDIRQSQYSELVNKVNAGKATTAQLLAMAKGFRDASRGDPDNDDWTETVTSLTDRVADEDLADAYQAYQHNRLSGPKLLAKINARLAGMVEGSPAWNELNRQREDLQERISDTARVERAATMNGKRAAGTVNDTGFLAYLRDEYNNAPEGTSQKIEAGNRLREFTFSLAEDKLRFDVQKGKKPVSALVAFYKAARAGMDPNSERYRALTLTIDSLARGGGSAGGGGGGGGGKGLAYYSKQLAAESTLVDILGGAKEPPGFKDLFRLDLRNITSRRWWDNNMRSAVAAYQRGDRTWTYYDKAGGTHQLGFSPGLMNEFDRMNLEYMRAGLASSDNTKDRQFWVGKIITATKALQTRGGQYTMDVYEKSFGDIQRAKEAALAGGRWAEYANLAREQLELARFILGGTVDVNQATNPYLTASMRARIARDLASISPQQLDANLDGYNPTGDHVLTMMQDDRIRLEVDPDGNVVSGKLDPNAGYLTQLDDGRITVAEFDINAAGNSVYDPTIDREVPAYLALTQAAVVRVNGQDIEIRQPTVDGGAALPVYVGKTGTSLSTPSETAFGIAGGLQVGPQLPASIPGASVSVDPYVVNGSFTTLPTKTFTTREGNKLVRWVSLDGKTWVRYVPGEVAPPRIVIGADYSFDGTKWTKDGKAVDPNAVLGSAHWWGKDDSKAAGQAWGIGGPGMTYTTRDAEADGRLDTRPTWMFREKKISGEREFDDDPDSVRRSYFTMEEDVEKARAAARASTVDRGLDSSARANAYSPRVDYQSLDAAVRGLAPTSTAWSSDLVPPDARVRPVTFHAPGRGPLEGAPNGLDIGLKPPPSSILRPAPSPTLAPLTIRSVNLKPLPPPKLPYTGYKGKAGVDAKKAALAAAAKKAKEAAAAKAAATPKAIGYRPPGHGELE